ncbi:VG15 protein [Nesterenkonia sp. K-15-9-6]|uniref:VG15 protein n=1 Tax=Nesterenkonia sp. K-15-9-6 TaxID=3093918 RepID=UPI004043A00C
MVQTLLGSPSSADLAGVNTLFTPADLQPYDSAVDDLLAVAAGVVNQAFRDLQAETVDTIRDELLMTVPATVSTYGPQIADVAGVQYQDMRMLSGITAPHVTRLSPGPSPQRQQSLVRWALSPIFSPTPSQRQAWSLLAGGLVRILLDYQRETMLENMIDDVIDGPVGYQRVPRAGCCAFCAMLASQAAVYGPGAGSDRTVVGRGTPLNQWRPGDRGRPAGGRRPRGSRDIGQLYHDYCRCRVVPTYRSSGVQLAEDAESYYQEYLDARRQLDDRKVLDWTETRSPDGSIRRKYTWRDRETGEAITGRQDRMILAWMRQQTGRA